MAQDDDASYKLLFSSPEMVRDLVVGFIPHPWLQRLDFATLQRMACGYVSDDLRQRNGDVLWRVQAEGEWVYLYLLLEFQSTVDPYMAVRVSSYVGLLYQDLVRADALLPDRRLPPVLPVVLYNGSGRWKASTELAALIPPLPDGLDMYRPRLSYVLIDENTYPDAQLAQMENLVAAVMRFEHPRSQQAMFELVDWLNRRLDGNPELKRSFAIWLGAVVSRQSKGTLTLPKVQDLKEMKMAMANHFEVWAEQYTREGMRRGMEQGVQQGVQQGEAMVLRKLLALRFGKVPPELDARIDTASPEQIDIWVERFIRASTLDEIFVD